MTEVTSFERTLQVAEKVVEVLRAERIDAVVIGAMALAVHGYPRETRDLVLDRNRSIDRSKLRELCAGYRLDRALEQVLALEAAP